MNLIELNDTDHKVFSYILDNTLCSQDFIVDKFGDDAHTTLSKLRDNYFIIVDEYDIIQVTTRGEMYASSHDL